VRRFGVSRVSRGWSSSLAIVLLAVGLGSAFMPSVLSSHTGAGALASASRQEKLTFFSQDLQRQMPYTVFLPPGYDSGSRRYPVLYMLHGLSGTNEEWTWYGLFQTADAMMRAGSIPPFIIVLPQGDDSYWVDHPGGPPWGQYLARDVVRDVDARFRTDTSAQGRALGGLSMGADGALQMALNFPDVFGTAVANSPVLRPYELASAFYGDAAFFDGHYPVTLVQDYPAVAMVLKLSLDIGASDEWLGNATAFHDELTALGVQHEWHVWPGGHDAAYWTARVPDDLRFVGAAFAGADPGTPKK
jgi:enterochelin esterase-like enzyme